MLLNRLIFGIFKKRSREYRNFPSTACSSGWVVVHPIIAPQMQEYGLWTADDYLQLPGVIVSGHPDRHVRRVHLPKFGQAYLKRQHFVTSKERFWNWRQGHGWISRSVREGRLLQQISQFAQNIPQWLAFGENSRNQAFLLVASLDDAVDLHHWLKQKKDLNLRDLARRIGEVIAQFHDYGFTLPDLTAKHVFVKSKTHQIALVDWASSRRRSYVPLKDRIHDLARLHASVPYELVGARERMALLSTAMAAYFRISPSHPNLSDLARRINRVSRLYSARSSLRDQRQGSGEAPELIWLAQEAVCVTTEAAHWWPQPPDAPPFYGDNPRDITWTLPSGESGYLMRGWTRLNLKGLWNHWRGYPLSSPGQRWARLLIHLQRRGIAAPRLLAFGHRPRSWHSLEWFVLCAPHSSPCSLDDDRRLIDLGRLLRQLHDADCLLVPSTTFHSFAIYGSRLYICQVKNIVYKRSINKYKITNNLQQILRYFSPYVHKFILYGYNCNT